MSPQHGIPHALAQEAQPLPNFGGVRKTIRLCQKSAELFHALFCSAFSPVDFLRLECAERIEAAELIARIIGWIHVGILDQIIELSHRLCRRAVIRTEKVIPQFFRVQRGIVRQPGSQIQLQMLIPERHADFIARFDKIPHDPAVSHFPEMSGEFMIVVTGKEVIVFVNDSRIPCRCQQMQPYRQQTFVFFIGYPAVQHVVRSLPGESVPEIGHVQYDHDT